MKKWTAACSCTLGYDVFELLAEVLVRALGQKVLLDLPRRVEVLVLDRLGQGLAAAELTHGDRTDTWQRDMRAGFRWMVSPCTNTTVKCARARKCKLTRKPTR